MIKSLGVGGCEVRDSSKKLKRQQTCSILSCFPATALQLGLKWQEMSMGQGGHGETYGRIMNACWRCWIFGLWA